MNSKLKLAARYLIAILALSLLVVAGVAIADLHDLRVLLGVAAGMFAGKPVFDLTNKIKALSDDSVQS